MRHRCPCTLLVNAVLYKKCIILHLTSSCLTEDQSDTGWTGQLPCSSCIKSHWTFVTVLSHSRVTAKCPQAHSCVIHTQCMNVIELSPQACYTSCHPRLELSPLSMVLGAASVSLYIVTQESDNGRCYRLGGNNIK